MKICERKVVYVAQHLISASPYVGEYVSVCCFMCVYVYVCVLKESADTRDMC